MDLIPENLAVCSVGFALSSSRHGVSVVRCLQTLLTLSLLLSALTVHGETKQGTDDLLPESTAAMISLRDRAMAEAKWEQTQLGHLVSMPELEPFVDQVRQRIQGELHQMVSYLGADWGIGKELGDGAITLAMVQPDGPKSVAFVLLVEVTATAQQRDATIEQLKNRLKSMGAEHAVEQIHGTSAHIYRRQLSTLTGREIVHAVSGKWFVAASDRISAESVLKRIRRSGNDSLANNPAYDAVIARTLVADEIEAMRWFIHPIRYAQSMRTLTANGQRGGSMLRAIANQGFDALQGVGGVVYLADGELDLRHNTFVYRARPLEKAARLLDFPNGPALHPRNWNVPNTANYISFRWRMKEAFECLQPLVDEVAEDAVFEQMLKDIKEDASGPQLDIRNDVVAHFGTRVTVVTACDHPIRPTSHQMFAAIDLTDGAAVAAALNDAMERDPKSTQLVIAGRRVWELGQQAEEELLDDDLMLTLEIEGGGVGFGPAVAPEPEPVAETEVTMPKFVLGVVGNQMIVASGAEFAEFVFEKNDAQETLQNAADYRRIDTMLTKLGCRQEALRVFSRTDEAYHSTYELLRRGESLESGALLGRLVNQAIEPADLETPRIDGSKLPPFEQIRPFLGPAGMSMETVADGWLIRGCLLRKQTAIHP